MTRATVCLVAAAACAGVGRAFAQEDAPVPAESEPPRLSIPDALGHS